MAYKIDLTGNKYGKLTVIEYAGYNLRHSSVWKCKCDCGNECEVISSNLRDGNTRSCGCLLKEYQHKPRKHGLYETRLYRIYAGILQRCFNPNDTAYKFYGNRGIKVCDEWLGENGFINFYNWSVNHGYQDDLSIDRIDNNKEYSPNNCRWTTHIEQMNNRRNTVFISVNGEVDTVSKLARKYGIPYRTLLSQAHGEKNYKYKHLRIEVVT